jgi:hypothetical protein
VHAVSLRLGNSSRLQAPLFSGFGFVRVTEQYHARETVKGDKWNPSHSSKVESRLESVISYLSLFPAGSDSGRSMYLYGKPSR